MADQVVFDHINLNEVDPSAAKVPDADYNFQVAGVQKKTYGPGATEYITVRLAITDSDKFTGRSYFESFFPIKGDGSVNQGVLKQLRRIMDATGIQQDTEQTLSDWLTDLQTQGARFNAPLKTAEELDKRVGKMIPRQRVNFWEVAPAV